MRYEIVDSQIPLLFYMVSLANLNSFEVEGNTK